MIVLTAGGSITAGTVGLFYAGMTVLAVVLVVAGARSRRRRETTLRRWAATTGWEYHGDDDTLVHRWQGKPFGVGGTRHATEVLSGQVGGRHAISFKYRYTIGMGKNRTRHTRHVIAVFFPTPGPVLEAMPDSGVGTRGRPAGGADVRFAEDAVLMWSSGRPKTSKILPRATTLVSLVDAGPVAVWGDPDRQVRGHEEPGSQR